MTAVVDFVPEGLFQTKDLDRFLFELERRVKQREVMNRKQAAAFIGISERQLDELCSKTKLPYHRIEGLSGKLFLREQLLDYIRKS